MGSSSNACWAGTYEPDNLRRFGEAITLGDAVYDVGANVGVYTLLASSKTGPNGKVYAFEPHPRNLDYLRRHIERNQGANCEIIGAGTCHLGSWLLAPCHGRAKHGQCHHRGKSTLHLMHRVM